MAAVGALADGDSEDSEEERCRKAAQANSEALGLLLGAGLLAVKALTDSRDKPQADHTAQRESDLLNRETENTQTENPGPILGGM